MTLHPGDWPLHLRQLNQRERNWNQSERPVYPRGDAVPFLPYPLPRFAQFLLEAVEALPGWACYDSAGLYRTPRFLDVGCGPGTKMQLVRSLFGFDCYGIDLVPDYIAECRMTGLSAEVADAFDYDQYHAFGLVLVNRPSSSQDKMEQLVCERMQPGAVLIALNWRNDPAKLAGFRPVSQEWGEPVHGVWAKPAGIVHLAPLALVAGETRCCDQELGALPAADSITTTPDDVTCRVGRQQPVGT